jgi:hypothetical protein
MGAYSLNYANGFFFSTATAVDDYHFEKEEGNLKLETTSHYGIIGMF